MRVLLSNNKAAIFGVLSRVWFAVGGAVTVLLIARHFSPALQGYYFTFYSLLAMQIFVELGLTAVIINYASHEWSRLQLNAAGEITGDQQALSRLRSLAALVIIWFRRGAVILFFIMALIGFIFFRSSAQAGIPWVMPWLLLCLFNAINLSLVPALALLEGCNQVNSVYFSRLIQEIVRSLATWSVIVVGGGLWALPFSLLAMIGWTLIYLAARYHCFFRSLLVPPDGPRFNWQRDIWPMQWRIAVSYLSGYITNSLFTPVLFYFHGPVIAGRTGLTWSMVMALSLISSMLILTRAPQIGIYVRNREYPQLERALWRSGLAAVSVAAAGALGIIAFIIMVRQVYPPLADRFLPLFPTILFLVSIVLMQISHAQAVYLRAHKREPFVWLSILIGIATLVLVPVLGRVYAANGVAVSYFLVVTLITLPVGTVIFWRCRRSWGSDDSALREMIAEEGYLHGQ